MAVKVMMPKGSDTMTEGKVLKWLKKEGDAISTGDTVVEIETDKVNMEVEAMGSGVLRKILVAVGKVVPVGELLAVIAKADEDISAFVKPNGASSGQEPAATARPRPVQHSPTASRRSDLAPSTPGPSPQPHQVLPWAAACWLRHWPSAWRRKWAWSLPTSPEPAPMEGSFGRTSSAAPRMLP